MKKCFIVAATIAALLFSEGICFRVLQWPYGAEMILCGLLLTVAIMLCYLVLWIFKKVEQDKYMASVAVAIACVVEAITFKMLHFAGCSVLVLVVMGGIVPMMVLWTAYRWWKKL